MKLAKRKGFTLVELLTVMSIIAILVGLLLPVIGKVRESGYNAQTKAMIGSLETAIENYRLDWGVYPDVTGISLAPAAPTIAQAQDSSQLLYFCLTTPFRKNVAVAGPTGGPAAITPTKTCGPYIEIKSEDTGTATGQTNWIMDGYNNPLAYNYNSDYNSATTPPVNNTESFDLWSFGSDGSTGTSDDLTNW